MGIYENGPLVKRSRRRPLTPETGVRFPYGSPKDIKRKLDYILVGVYYNDGPPVPISNTVVKFIRADNT